MCVRPHLLELEEAPVGDPEMLMDYSLKRLVNSDRLIVYEVNIKEDWPNRHQNDNNITLRVKDLGGVRSHMVAWFKYQFNDKDVTHLSMSVYLRDPTYEQVGGDYNGLKPEDMAEIVDSFLSLWESVA